MGSTIWRLAPLNGCVSDCSVANAGLSGTLIVTESVSACSQFVGFKELSDDLWSAFLGSLRVHRHTNLGAAGNFGLSTGSIRTCSIRRNGKCCFRC